MNAVSSRRRTDAPTPNFGVKTVMDSPGSIHLADAIVYTRRSFAEPPYHVKTNMQKLARRVRRDATEKVHGMRQDTGKVFRIEDYRPTDFLIPKTNLAFDLSPDAT